MAGFPMKERQAIIDGYLAASGRNLFVPSEFVDWLADQPDNPAYELFYSMDDATAAREHRISMARGMAAGLRITARVQESSGKGKAVTVSIKEFPSLISPIEGRKSGGGYVQFDPDDAALAAELRRQGAQALRAWLARYRGIAEAGGLDVSAIEEIAGRLDGTGVVVAA